MSQHTVFGVSAGFVVGLGSAISPIGDIPSALFLLLQGVSNPMSCLSWMKNPTEVTFASLHPCSPNTDAASLSIASGGLVFIAIGLLVWKGIEMRGKA